MSGLGGLLCWGVVGGASASILASGTGRSVLGRHLLRFALAAASAATALLAWALVTNDFTVAYVADQSARETPPSYRLAGLWGGMEGSLLLWVCLLAGWGLLASRAARRLGPVGAARAVRVSSGVVLGFALPLVTVSRPFRRLAVPALDGGGLSPVLEHPAMLYHPPLLYLGYAALVVPFVLAVAMVGAEASAGRVRWLAGLRWYALLAWTLLTLGLATGAHWAYQELGWGGFWAWDPVENAALIPWLVVTALLHTATVDQRRGPTSRATVGLAVAPFVLAAFGALLTRSGAAVSVHVFAEAPRVGLVLLGVLLVLVVTAVISVRRHAPGARAQVRPAAAPTGRRGDALVAAGSWLLVAAAAVVFIGTAVPVVDGLITGGSRVIDSSFFIRYALPPAAAAVLVLLCLPVASRRHVRVSRASLAHAGIVVIAAGICSSAYASSTTVVLHRGDRVDLPGGWAVVAESFTEDGEPRRAELGAVVLVERSSREVGRVEPELHLYDGAATPQSEAGLASTPFADLLLVPQRIDLNAGAITLKVHHRPLAAWIWAGAAMLVVAGSARLIRRRATLAASAPATAPPSPPAPASRVAARVAAPGALRGPPPEA